MRVEHLERDSHSYTHKHTRTRDLNAKLYIEMMTKIYEYIQKKEENPAKVRTCVAFFIFSHRYNKYHTVSTKKTRTRASL